MDSNALILQVGGSDTQDGTLVRGGVGLTMAQLMNAGGKVVTRVLNAGYTGPYNPKNHIQDFFSEGEERERALDELYKADRDDLSKRYKQLLKHCRALLKYALPEYVLQSITVRRALSLVHHQMHSHNAAYYLQDSCRNNHSISWDQVSISPSKVLSKAITVTCFPFRKSLESTSPAVW